MDIAPVQTIAPVFDVPTATRPPIRAGGAPVATELAAAASVQQPSAGHSASADPDPTPSDGHSPVVDRNLSIDPDTQQIVYRAIDARGEIVLQLPDQAALRRRAYARDVLEAAEKTRGTPTIERFI